MSLIQTKALCKNYQMGPTIVKALDGVDMQVKEGEFVAIMGQSGSGKSTLMNIIGCLDRPTSGQYRLHGTDVSLLNKVQLAAMRNQTIGFIFQSFNLLSRTTALRNVTLPLTYRRGKLSISPAQRDEMGMAALDAVGLSDRAHHEPNELSGGQRQRVAIARALVNNPALIMADEPTGNLDSQTSREIMAILHDLHKRGRTIVMVTHESEIAEQTERIISLHDGRIAVDRRNNE